MPEQPDTTHLIWPPNGLGVPHSYTLFCPPLPTSPRIAREFVASVLHSLELDDLIDAATMCTSELVTNAVVHAQGIGNLLWLAVEHTHIRLTVYDGSPAKPTLTDMDEDGENGRGLWLLEVLTDGRWGTEPGAPLGINGREGKGVWCELAAPITNPALSTLS
ncbi:ATP-binding protein [Streptomyces sp. NBC_00237]|uniref:ATP-binding protein n=1 Tax=Streptomyces sp. NBC_00237 TaxID=2975687 RepID=UPI00224DC148|nr:ATP-binding protein [Streptomyces sp. NBC_00237]MCX5204132.1 ATP-binding protein [Streptomyces sp. NBC_00237]